MTTDTRYLTVPFTVPEGFNHTWLITHHSDICAVTGVQGENRAAITTGRMEPSPMVFFSHADRERNKSCFQDWLAEAIGEMAKMCKEEL